LKILVYVSKLFKASGIDGFTKTALFIPPSGAICLLEQGIGTVEDIDKGMKLPFGRRMGPFENGDMVGLDVTYGVLMACYEETKDRRFYPPQLL
jgi:3-hydroxyacyl-CoA dehydrogenase